MRAASIALLLLVAPAAAESGPGAARVTAEEARRAWLDAFVERFRDEACGMHWAGNPVYPSCIAQLRWEAERAYATRRRADTPARICAAAEPDPLRGPRGRSDRPPPSAGH